MKKLLLILFVFFKVWVFAQKPYEPTVSYMGNGGLRIHNIQNKKSIVKGEYYYNKYWYLGTIELFSGVLIKDYPLKYDMKMNQIDIKVDGEVKALSVWKVKEIRWVNTLGVSEIFRNSIIYDKDSQGLFLIIYDGKVPLLKKTFLKLQEANYNPALDVGDKTDQYTKVSTYYTTSNSKLKKIKNNKKHVLKLFKDKKEQIKKYASDNNLSYKKDYDLAKIFEYYNSL